MKFVKATKVERRGRILDVCSHGECLSSTIWDYETCWEHLTEGERENLRERVSALLRSRESYQYIVLSGADLRGFDFTGADLSHSFLNGCNLVGCKFIDANLAHAFLAGADLTGSDLTRADLEGTVFSGANLYDVTLLAYSISFGRDPINLTRHSFGEERLFRRPHIDEHEPYFAEATYRALKAHFSAIGKYDDASWASFCERLMQRKVLWETKKYLSWAVSLFMSASCGYGERPFRPFIASIAVVVLYAIIYQLFGIVVTLGATSITNWIDGLAFSFATFCSYSFPDLVSKSDSVARLLVTTEAFAGIFALGLFVFTLTKRYVAR